ncbi:serine carboxypeptidase-like 40 [Dorcoceras hygrometricum]|uniref:Serine carboxypeptidase-like 40 n=1 Tax=Dorcoceras hygrometricum TaxID=472368 RepID=A0A2Z7CCC4_9LAMI|nr:serine carboxypeptidase-like 40 [Dorcoceras hygrometricum]
MISKYSRTSLDKEKPVNRTREKENRFQKEKKDQNVLSYDNKKGPQEGSGLRLTNRIPLQKPRKYQDYGSTDLFTPSTMSLMLD